MTLAFIWLHIVQSIQELLVIYYFKMPELQRCVWITLISFAPWDKAIHFYSQITVSKRTLIVMCEHEYVIIGMRRLSWGWEIEWWSHQWSLVKRVSLDYNIIWLAGTIVWKTISNGNKSDHKGRPFTNGNRISAIDGSA